MITKQEILRLEVSVDDSFPVEILQGGDHTAEVETGGGVIKPAWRSGHGSGQVRSGQVRSGQVRSGQVRLG